MASWLDEEFDRTVRYVQKELIFAATQRHSAEMAGRAKSIRLRIVSAAPSFVASSSGNEILVSRQIGQIVVQYSAFGLVLNRFKGQANSQCASFLSALETAFMSRERSAVPDAFQYCGISRQLIDAEIAKALRDRVAATLVASVALVLAHEYGHHLWDHFIEPRESPRHRQKLEAEADFFASKVLQNKILRTLGLPILDLVSRVDAKHPFSTDAGSGFHECRVFFFYLTDVQAYGEPTFGTAGSSTNVNPNWAPIIGRPEFGLILRRASQIAAKKKPEDCLQHLGFID